jgi:hypothetical protein
MKRNIIEAMLKWSRKRLMQRKNKPLARHVDEKHYELALMNAETTSRPGRAHAPTRSRRTAMQTSRAAIQLRHLMTAHMEYSNET